MKKSFPSEEKVYNARDFAVTREKVSVPVKQNLARIRGRNQTPKSPIPTNRIETQAFLPDPIALGPYNVGFQTVYDIPLPNGQMTNLAIWYPSNQQYGPPADYTTWMVNPSALFTLPSKANARENIPICPGKYPLVVLDHGGFYGNRDAGRFQSMHYAEHYASHGFISVGYTHHGTIQQLVLEGNAVINYMVTESSLVDSIQQDNICLFGSSAGGIMVTGLAAGTPYLAKNPNIKGLMTLEPALAVNKNILSNITIPGLVFSTGYNYVNGNAHVLATAISRNNIAYEVNAKKFDHLSQQGTMLCDSTEINREIAISRGIYEPLAVQSSDPYASTAYTFWHIGDKGSWTQFGDGSNFCQVDDWTPSVDPSLLTYDSRTLLEDDVFERMKLYTTAFLQVHIAGNQSFAYYLTEEYTNNTYSKDDITLNVM